jgi:hypothetical protein
VGLTLAQQAVDATTKEITQVETVWRQLVLQDRVVTMEALLPTGTWPRPWWTKAAILS